MTMLHELSHLRRLDLKWGRAMRTWLQGQVYKRNQFAKFLEEFVAESSAIAGTKGWKEALSRFPETARLVVGAKHYKLRWSRIVWDGALLTIVAEGVTWGLYATLADD
jgi:hypothetical protein